MNQQIIKQLEALEEVKRLNKLGKDAKQLKQFAIEGLAEELKLSLNYLNINIQKFTELLLEIN